MKTLILSLAFLALSVGVGGCAHEETKKVDEKVAAEPATSQRHLRAWAEDLVENAKNLKPEQKTALKNLWTESDQKMDELSGKSRRLEALLVTKVLTNPYDPAEVKQIKKDLSKIEHGRLTLYFESLNATNKILGRWGSEGERDKFYEMMEVSDPFMMF